MTDSIKKIVMISHGDVEAENEGHFIHANNVARAFAKHSTLLVLEYSKDEKKVVTNGIVYQHLPILGKNHHTKPLLIERLLTFSPTQIFKEQYKSLYHLIKYKKEIINADFVILQGALLLSAFFLCKWYKRKIIIDTHWINYDVAKLKTGVNRVGYYVRKWIWFLIEFVLFHLSSYILVVSSKDADSASKNFRLPQKKILTIPQIIDFEKYTDTNDLPAEQLRSRYNEKVLVTFVGTLKSVQNQEALRFIIHDLAPKFNECQFLIIGAEKMEEIGNIVKLPFQKNIYAYLHKSDILISPVDVGSGVKFKILDYLFAEKYILATPPNFDGLPLVAQMDGIEIVDLPNTYNSLKKIIDTKIYKKVFPEHRDYVLKYHSLGTLATAVTKLFDNDVIY